MAANEFPRAGGRGGRSSGVPGSVWLREPPSYRGTPPLRRELIVSAAVALLDEQGVAMLTMRRLAQRLEVGATTLYWHVRTKDDVLDLALDAIFADVALPEPVDSADADWQRAVTELIRGWRAAMLRHPWSAALIGRPLLGPNVLRRSEFLHQTLAGAGFSGAELVAAAHALANYVVGTALTESSWHQASDPGVLTATGEYLRDQAERYPTLAGVTGAHDDEWTFEQGLRLLLAGLVHGSGIFCRNCPNAE